MMSKKIRHLYLFDTFCLNVTEKIFLRNQELIPLTPKAFDTLLFLVQKNGQLVEKDELMAAVWPDSFVVENSLTQNIHQLRKAMGEKPDGSSFIETIPRRGYRFYTDVREIIEDEPELVYHGTQMTRVLMDEKSNDNLVGSEIIHGELIEFEQDFIAEADTVEKTKTEEKVQPALSRKPLESFLSKRNVIIICAVLVVALVAFAFWQWQKQTTGFHPKSIAILPFKPLRQNESDERLGVGMADALIMKLSRQQQLQVKPTSAIIKYAGQEHNPIEIGKRLEVDAIVEGTIQREESRIRVNVQVLDVKTAMPIWSGKFDELYTDIFTVQDVISERVSEVIALELNPTEKQHLAKRYTNNTEAYQAYLTGVYFWNKRTKEDLVKAVEYLQQAVMKDPNYALGYAVLADCYYLQKYYGYVDWTSEEAYQKVVSEANKALAIDPNLAEAHVALAGTQISFQRDYKSAEESFRRAIASNPNYSTAHLRYGWLLHATGRLPDSLNEMRKAQQLDPLSATNNSALGSMLIKTRQFDEALRYCRRAVELEPNMPVTRLNFAEALKHKGFYDEAIAEYQKLMSREDLRSDAIQGLTLTYAVAGRREESEKYLTEMHQMSNNAKIPVYNFAIIYAALGNKDKAFEWMNKMEKGSSYVGVVLRNDPDVDSLRDDPRFEELLKKYPADFQQNKSAKE